MQRDTINSLVGVGFVILVILILLQYTLFKTQGVTVTLLLLGCVWMLDIFLKIALDFDNATAFADLSFSAFVFHLGTIFSVLENQGTATEIEADYIYTALVTVILTFCWIVNLYVCKTISKDSTIDKQAGEGDGCAYLFHVLLSFVLACISVGVFLIG